MSGKRILIVEDDADSANILEAYLLRDGYEVALAEDGQRGLDLYKSWQPDLILLDVMLPRLSGTEVLSAVRRSSDTPVIMVTAMGDEPEKLGALRYGADDYVVKPYSPREVVARVTAILRRARPAPAADGGGQVARGRLSLDPDAWLAHWDGRPLARTVTEFGILRTLAAAPAKVFTRDAIIDRLRGPGFAITDRTVDSHVRNLRGKFAALGAHDVIETRAGVGYRLGACLGQGA